MNNINLIDILDNYPLKDQILLFKENKDVYGVIYKITNCENNKCYIGQSKNFKYRKNNHFNSLNENSHYNKHFQSSFNKYGKDSFMTEIVDFSFSKEELNDKEREWIWLNNSTNENFGYNLRDGNDFFPGSKKIKTNRSIELTEDQIKKRSERVSGDKNPTKRPEVRKKISDTYKLRKKYGIKDIISNEGREKLRTAIGKIWIVKNDVEKYIKKEEVVLYEKEGWIRGRKSKIGEHLTKGNINHGEHSKNKIWIYREDDKKGVIRKRVKKESIDKFLKDNWKVGTNTDYAKNTLSKKIIAYNDITKDKIEFESITKCAKYFKKDKSDLSKKLNKNNFVIIDDYRLKFKNMYE